MFASLKKLVGNITVDVYDKVVTVEGVPTHVITGDIRRVWGTSKIEANLFLKIEDSSFSFHEFFCLEVHYAISRLIEERKTRANRRTLAKILTALETYTWLANTKLKFPPKLDHSVVKDFVYPPLPHQEGFFEAYDQVTQQFDLHGSMLAGAAGSGKTYAGLVWSEMLHADHVIILAPKNALHLVWEKNIREVFKTPQSYWMSDSDKPYAGQKFIIANYEFLVTLLEMARHISRKKLAIVLDESHNLNEVRSLRTERFLELCEMTNCQNVLWLSGTPIKALAVEAIPFIRCIDPLFTPDVEAAFRKIFGVSSVRAMDMLNHRLTGLLYTIEKKELGLDDPVFEEIKVKVPHGERFTLEAIAHEMRKFTEERYAYYAERKPRDEKIFYDALDYFTRHAERSQKTQLPYYYRCLDTVIRSGGDARLCAEEMMFCNRFEKREVVPLLPKEMKEPFRDSKSVVKYV